jgi:hypothetical protein
LRIMLKKTSRSKINPKARKKLLTRCQKERFWWGKVNMQRPRAFIEPVGSPSRRCNNVVWTRAALETSGQVARVRTVNFTVRPLVAVYIRTKAEPSGRFTLKNKKLKKNLQNLIFLKSVLEHACIIH